MLTIYQVCEISLSNKKVQRLDGELDKTIIHPRVPDTVNYRLT